MATNNGTSEVLDLDSLTSPSFTVKIGGKTYTAELSMSLKRANRVQFLTSRITAIQEQDDTTDEEYEEYGRLTQELIRTLIPGIPEDVELNQLQTRELTNRFFLLGLKHESASATELAAVLEARSRELSSSSSPSTAATPAPGKNSRKG